MSEQLIYMIEHYKLDFDCKDEVFFYRGETHIDAQVSTNLFTINFKKKNHSVRFLFGEYNSVVFSDNYTLQNIVDATYNFIPETDVVPVNDLFNKLLDSVQEPLKILNLMYRNNKLSFDLINATAKQYGIDPNFLIEFFYIDPINNIKLSYDKVVQGLALHYKNIMEPLFIEIEDHGYEPSESALLKGTIDYFLS